VSKLGAVNRKYGLQVINRRTAGFAQREHHARGMGQASYSCGWRAVL